MRRGRSPPPAAAWDRGPGLSRDYGRGSSPPRHPDWEHRAYRDRPDSAAWDAGRGADYEWRSSSARGPPPPMPRVGGGRSRSRSPPHPHHVHLGRANGYHAPPPPAYMGRDEGRGGLSPPRRRPAAEEPPYSRDGAGRGGRSLDVLPRFVFESSLAMDVKRVIAEGLSCGDLQSGNVLQSNVQALGEMPVGLAVEAVQEFRRIDKVRIKHPAAFFNGVMKRIMQDARLEPPTPFDPSRLPPKGAADRPGPSSRSRSPDRGCRLTGRSPAGSPRLPGPPAREVLPPPPPPPSRRVEVEAPHREKEPLHPRERERDHPRDVDHKERGGRERGPVESEAHRGVSRERNRERGLVEAEARRGGSREGHREREVVEAPSRHAASARHGPVDTHTQLPLPPPPPQPAAVSPPRRSAAPAAAAALRSEEAEGGPRRVNSGFDRPPERREAVASRLREQDEQVGVRGGVAAVPERGGRQPAAHAHVEEERMRDADERARKRDREGGAVAAARAAIAAATAAPEYGRARDRDSPSHSDPAAARRHTGFGWGPADPAPEPRRGRSPQRAPVGRAYEPAGPFRGAGPDPRDLDRGRPRLFYSPPRTASGHMYDEPLLPPLRRPASPMLPLRRGGSPPPPLPMRRGSPPPPMRRPGSPPPPMRRPGSPLLPYRGPPSPRHYLDRRAPLLPPPHMLPPVGPPLRRRSPPPLEPRDAWPSGPVGGRTRSTGFEDRPRSSRPHIRSVAVAANGDGPSHAARRGVQGEQEEGAAAKKPRTEGYKQQHHRESGEAAGARPQHSGGSGPPQLMDTGEEEVAMGGAAAAGGGARTVRGASGGASDEPVDAASEEEMGTRQEPTLIDELLGGAEGGEWEGPVNEVYDGGERDDAFNMANLVDKKQVAHALSS